MRSLTLASLLVLFSFIFAVPSYASSASGPGQTSEAGFGIAPVPAADPAVTASGYFIYKVAGSTNVTGSVMLKNPGSKPVEIQLAGVDSLTAQTGGSAFTTADVTPTGAATWLKFAETSVILPAGRQQPVEFTVSVPSGLRPGQYLAGISAYVLGAKPTPGPDQPSSTMGASVTMQTRYIIGVEVDIEGVWTPALKIESAALVQQPSGPFIGLSLKNDGDVFLKPTGTITMTDTAGKIVLEQSIEMGTFIPGTSVVYPINWSGEMAQGMYDVNVRLDYGENQTETYANTLEIAPVKAVVQDTNNAAQEPGTIGGASPVEVSPQAPSATTQTQGGDGAWLWIVIVSSMGSILLVAAALLVLNKSRRLRLQDVKKA